MVRETRHLWVGNLPENIREDRIRDHFKRYGRVQSVKLLGGRGDKDEVCATVSFMDIKSAAKAHHSEQKLDERVLTTEYHEPAAIPTPNYSRFHLGSEELSSSFDRSSHFYDRGERGEGAGGYLRRSGYHSGGESLSRTRPRDRASYRNGPFTPIIESVVSRSGNSGSHHGNSGRSGGGGSWSYESPSPRYPPTTPDISYQEPAPILVHKKHSKSRHVNCRSGSDSGSNSSRSRSSSASSQSESSSCSTESSSPNSEKSCSAQSQQSTLRSGVQSSGATNHTSSNSPAVHSEDRRPLAICVRNLPARSSDTSLKDGLYHEYKKHGKVTWVKVVGQGVDRYALVSFKKPEDVDKALQVSHDKLFFGCKIEVAPYQGYDVDDNEFRPFEAEQDEFHPKATRTLFIGNLDKDITTQEIRKHFDQFGEIIDIDIKKQGTSASYAFCQFSDIGSVVRAMRSLDGEHVGGNRVKLGFGKSMHTSCVWVDGVAESVSEKYLSQQFGQFGPVSHVVIDRARGQALVSYDQITYAQQAVKEMRGAVLRGRKLQVDYASRECQESFYDHMEKQTSSSNHPPAFENSHSVTSSPQNLRVFETPSSSTTAPCAGSGSAVSSRYNNCSRYGTSRGVSGTASFGRSSSPSSTRSSRHSISRFQEYPSTASSAQDYEKRSSYRSYEDVAQVEENSAPTTGAGDIRHLQKERVSLLEQLEDCQSSGEEGTSRRRCNKHRRSASGEGSRPGTPLCDERPENLGPVEPRRPRESKPPETLSLPLPRFAAQVLSPRPAPPSPPASPQTHSSSSSDTEPSPEWEERLRSLDEKYEKWSGSRAGVTKVDPSTVKVRHKLLDLDLHELQPSEIVKSVLAKRSVFDEDSKRLENFGEKYEPREFVPARSSLLRGRIDLSPMSSPVMKSPSSPAAKGLQYPFPSHPPVQPTTSVATTTAPSVTTVTVATTEVKPSATTFLANCTTSRQFPPPKISSPQTEKCDTNPRTPSTKVLPTSTTLTKPIMSCKPIQESKKEPMSIQTKAKTVTPLRRESCDDKKEDVRRKSRDESIESIDIIKRDDTSECDKIKDAQVTERRKSVCEKRSSADIRDSCERTKDNTDKRRGSSETDSESNKKLDKKLCDESHTDTPKLEGEKNKKGPSDCTERRKETDTNIRHSIDVDKKKDVLGVNSEKDRRRNRESTDLSDNPKYKKVPDNKKELDAVDKREDDMKIVDSERKKESSESCTVQHLNRHKDKKDHQDRRRDSSEHNDKKVERISPENPEVHRIKERKTNHDLSEPRNSKKHHDENDSKCDTVKHKDSERRKNSENEISKEHSLFKKVFGFAERTYGHHKDRRDSDSTAVKTDETIKHKRDHSDKERKKDKESDHSESSKHRSRKSPDQPENNRHKERKHSESSEKRSRKEYEQSDEYKQKDDHSDSFHSKSRDRKEERSKDNNKNIFSVDQEFLPLLGKHRENDRRKETLLDETRISEADSNDLKLKDGECKKENEVFFDRRKDENSESRNRDERRKDSEKYFDNEKYNNDRIKKDDSDSFKDLERKSDLSSDFLKFKHDRQRDNDRKREVIVENCRPKDLKDDHRHDTGKHKDDRKNEDLFESLKSKDDNFRFRDYARKKDSDVQEHIRIKDIIDSKKKEEKEKKKDRESQEISFKKSRDLEDKNRDIEKSKRKKEFEIIETKLNGDHDDYLDSIECRKPNYEEEVRIDPIKKDKKKERNNTWPAPIGCKRRLSSQDSLEIVEDVKRSKPERRDSKDSGRSSGSSRKGSSEKHKGYTKLLEEKIKEDKEHEQRKKDDLLLESSEKNDEKILKPAIRKEKRNSGEKRKEERKYKNRPRENGTASESDIGSGDDETKSNKRQHSIFDIVVDEPYISMYDKVKARSTKNMQKQEEEKRQEKLKEKFHQLKASRAKREEKKRSTSFDEDSDSEKGSSRRSNKLLITSSDEDGCSESEMRIRSRKVLCDTSEDDNDTMSVSRTVNKYSDYDSKSSRKIISDISEDDTVIKPSTPKLKPSRNISFEADLKTRKIMSDTSEDESARHIARQKPSRIQSDESEGDLGFEDSIRNEAIRVKATFHEPTVKIVDVFASRPVEMNHFTGNDHEQKQHPLQSSPESIRRISFDSATSEQPRKKSHKKKQKKKNYEVSEDGTIIIRKHSSKKEKKKSHRDNDEEDKKSRKKKTERESSSNKKEEKLEDIFGPLSDDSEKTGLSKWQVPQVYGSDSESERENIRKKEKKRREKKLRELDEAGRAIEAKLLDTSEDITEEPIKVKKKKRKKSRDEKIKHHRIADEESVPSVISKENDSTSETKQIGSDVVKNSDVIKIEIDTERNDEKTHKMDIDFDEQVCKEETHPVIRQHSSSLSGLLDSPPAQPIQHKKPDIPGFGSEVDENIHETAVKSISDTGHEEQPPQPQEKYDEKSKPEEQAPTEDKPTTVISQEETEDAVAALLMEDTFGSGFERYSEDTPKPDTPVSEPDLQIDTDTEDTFDPPEFKTPREPDVNPPFFQQNNAREGLEERIMPLACSAEPSVNKQPEKPTEVIPFTVPKAEETPPTCKVPETFEGSENTLKEEHIPKEDETPCEKTENKEIEAPAVVKEEVPDVKMDIDLPPKNETSNSITDTNETITDKTPNSCNSNKSVPSPMTVEPMSSVKEEPEDSSADDETVLNEAKRIKLEQDPSNDSENPTKCEVQKVIKQEGENQDNQTNISPDLPNAIKPPISEANTVVVVPSTAVTNVIKPELVHQGGTVGHGTVLVHQSLQQPQTAQVVKPLTIQVINPPALKPLDLPPNSKTNTGPVVSLKLNSPPDVLATTTQAPSKQKPHPTGQGTVPKSPLHHMPSFQEFRKLSNPSIPLVQSHLVPSHLPVKPASQISLQTPQLTPISKGSAVPTTRPLVVHTIQQNHSSQKQLHIVPPVTQLSPQPISPQNLKVIRPVQNQPLTIRPPTSPQSAVNRPPHPTNSPIPLLQTVTPNEASLNKHVPVRPPVHLANAHVLQSVNQAPQPEKIINLTPNQSLQNIPVALTQKLTPVSAVKTEVNKPTYLHENNVDAHDSEKTVEIAQDNQKPLPTQSTAPSLIKPTIQINSVNETLKDSSIISKKENEEVRQTSHSGFEQKHTKPTFDEAKPLNAVIQDLTIRAANKALGKISNLSNISEIKSESPKPIEQVVREIQLRKQAAFLPSETDKAGSPLSEIKSKEEVSDANNAKEEPEIKQEKEEEIKDPSDSSAPTPLASNKESKIKEEEVKEIVKPSEEVKVVDELSCSKEKKIVENEDVQDTPTSLPSDKCEPKSSPEPESQTPKSHKDSEPEIPSSEERVTPEKSSTTVIHSGRGRGGRTRGKRGRGAGVMTRRGGRHTSTTVTHSTPSRPQAPADVYEFRDDSEEERPRLILTIKPEQPLQQSNNQVPSTRKSRRLQEKDGSRTTVDDTIEDVIRHTGRPGRRATRSTAPLLSVPTAVESTRKSPRRKQPSQSQPASHERSPTPTPPCPVPTSSQLSTSPQPAKSPTPQPNQSPSQPQQQQPPKSPQVIPQSSPATTPQSQTIALSSSQKDPQVQPQKEQPPQQEQQLVLSEKEEQVKPIQQKEIIPPQRELQVQRREQQPSQVQHQLPQKPHIPTKQIVQSQTTVKLPPKLQATILNKNDLKPLISQRTHGIGGEPTNLIDPVTGLLIPMREEEGQYIPVGGEGGDQPPEKRPRLDDGVGKAPVATVRPSVVRPPQQPPYTVPKPGSPPHLPPRPVVNSTVPRPPKAHLLQAVAAENAKIAPPTRPKLIPPQTMPIQAPKPPTPLTPKAHILQSIGNAQAREGIIGSPAPHQGSILTGSVASPPLRTHQQPIVTGASSSRFVMKGHSETPGSRVGPDGGCIVVPSPSPQPPPRGQVMQAGLPVPAYEASLGEVVQHVNYQGHIQPAHYVHPHPQIMSICHQYLRDSAIGSAPYHRGTGNGKDETAVVRGSPPLELRRRASPHDRTTDSPQVATLYGRAHLYPPPPVAHRPVSSTRHQQVTTPPHASQVPPQGDSLLVLLERHPVLWQGLLALKNDQAAVQMHYIFGNPLVARDSLPLNSDGSTPPLRIAQRMRLEQTQLDGVARKMQMDNEHCMLLALPCGRDHLDVLQQSYNLRSGFITYLQQKQAAGIVNIAAPGSRRIAAYVVHIFPASEFANESLARIAPHLLHRVTDIAHLLIVIATV